MAHQPATLRDGRGPARRRLPRFPSLSRFASRLARNRQSSGGSTTSVPSTYPMPDLSYIIMPTEHASTAPLPSEHVEQSLTTSFALPSFPPATIVDRRGFSTLPRSYTTNALLNMEPILSRPSMESTESTERPNPPVSVTNSQHTSRIPRSSTQGSLIPSYHRRPVNSANRTDIAKPRVYGPHFPHQPEMQSSNLRLPSSGPSRHPTPESSASVHQSASMEDNKYVAQKESTDTTSKSLAKPHGHGLKHASHHELRTSTIEYPNAGPSRIPNLGTNASGHQSDSMGLMHSDNYVAHEETAKVASKPSGHARVVDVPSGGKENQKMAATESRRGLQMMPTQGSGFRRLFSSPSSSHAPRVPPPPPARRPPPVPGQRHESSIAESSSNRGFSIGSSQHQGPSGNLHPNKRSMLPTRSKSGNQSHTVSSLPGPIPKHDSNALKEILSDNRSALSPLLLSFRPANQTVPLQNSGTVVTPHNEPNLSIPDGSFGPGGSTRAAKESSKQEHGAIGTDRSHHEPTAKPSPAAQAEAVSVVDESEALMETPTPSTWFASTRSPAITIPISPEAFTSPRQAPTPLEREFDQLTDGQILRRYGVEAEHAFRPVQHWAGRFMTVRDKLMEIEACIRRAERLPPHLASIRTRDGWVNKCPEGTKNREHFRTAQALELLHISARSERAANSLFIFQNKLADLHRLPWLKVDIRRPSLLARFLGLARSSNHTN